QPHHCPLNPITCLPCTPQHLSNLTSRLPDLTYISPYAPHTHVAFVQPLHKLFHAVVQLLIILIQIPQLPCHPDMLVPQL
ncbi:MAG: hypothetical protein Q9214_007958, partial [Letrouitia sp. 1 TL-2023]